MTLKQVLKGYPGENDLIILALKSRDSLVEAEESQDKKQSDSKHEKDSTHWL